MIKVPERDKSIPHPAFSRVRDSYSIFDLAINSANQGKIVDIFRLLRESQHQYTLGTLHLACTSIIEGRHLAAAVILAASCLERSKLFSMSSMVIYTSMVNAATHRLRPTTYGEDL